MCAGIVVMNLRFSLFLVAFLSPCFVVTNTHTPAVCMASGIEEIFNSLQFQVGLGARLITRGDRFLIPGIGSIAQETRVLWDEEVTTFRFMPRRAGHLASRRGRRRAHSAPSQSSQKFCSHKVTSRQIYIGVRMLFGLQSEN
jgi:hypothetical protein